MPHDAELAKHWHEPKAGENAGFGNFKRPAMPYDRFMDAEGVPVFRGIGCKRVQDLPMAPWKRLGGRGSYIQLYGTEGLWGMYVIEIPPGGERRLCYGTALVELGAGLIREGVSAVEAEAGALALNGESSFQRENLEGDFSRLRGWL